jgi:hypothetical protein
MPGNGNDSFVEAIKNNGGLVLAAFIGVANFIGISSGEIPNILRNYDTAADLAGTLILLALLVAIVSSLMPKKRPIWIGWLAPIFLAVITLAFLPRILIKIPTGSTFGWLVSIAFLVALGISTVLVLVAVSIVWAILFHSTPKSREAARSPASRPTRGSSPPSESPSSPVRPSPGAAPVQEPNGASTGKSLKGALKYRLDYKAPLLVVALVLSVIATYSAVRAETASQSLGTRPMITSTLTLTDNVYSLSVKVDASRLAADNLIRLTVYAWSDKVSPSNPAPAPDACAQESCKCQAKGCTVIGDGYYGPDQNGNVDATYNVTFTEGSYSNIEIIGNHTSPHGTRCASGRPTYCSASLDFIVAEK